MGVGLVDFLDLLWSELDMDGIDEIF